LMLIASASAVRLRALGLELTTPPFARDGVAGLAEAPDRPAPRLVGSGEPRESPAPCRPWGGQHAGHVRAEGRDGPGGRLVAHQAAPASSTIASTPIVATTGRAGRRARRRSSKPTPRASPREMEKNGKERLLAGAEAVRRGERAP
jgi:hypothetical protein